MTQKVFMHLDFNTNIQHHSKELVFYKNEKTNKQNIIQDAPHEMINEIVK